MELVRRSAGIRELAVSRYDIKQGDVIDGFVIGEQLHTGGMAILWHATHPDIEGEIVFKVPKILEGEDPTVIVGFEMEMMILPKLTGPHVPKVYGVGDFSTVPYIAMERVRGDTLFPMLEKAPIPVEDVISIGRKLTTALVDLHRQKVIHHDIKPSNIMIRTTGEAVFIDYGLSRHLEMPDLLEAEFHLPMGTAPYISPEQVRQFRAEPRSDLFSLAVLLYHLLTGERPFGLPRSQQALKKRLWRDPVPPRKIRPETPPWLQEVILRCLEVKPANRFPTAARLAFALQNPDSVRLTKRAEKMHRDGLVTVFRRWLKARALPPLESHSIGAPSASIVMVAVDLDEQYHYLREALLDQTTRLLSTMTDVRLACVNVNKVSTVFMNDPFDDKGQNVHIKRLVELKDWARPIALASEKISFHVLEHMDPAEALIEFAVSNHADQILMCARGAGNYRRFLGSVSSQVVARAPCTVTVVRAASPVGEKPPAANEMAT